MDIEVRPCASVEELLEALIPIGHYFGIENQLEDVERFAQMIEIERVHAAFDGERIVGGAGAFTYEVSVPGGGSVPAAGVSVVGVLPTHRRRGVLTAMMRAQLDDSKARGEVAAYLWASEAAIYGRFGYGLASRMGSMSLASERTRFAEPFEARGTVRIVGLEEAARVFPPLYEQVRAQRAGMFTRSANWWEMRRLYDNPARRQGGPKHRVLLELDGRPAGYAIYNVKQEWHSGSTKGVVNLTEVMTPTAEAARELWRWLLDFDWTSEFAADFLPLDHELFLLLAEPRRLQFKINEGVWLRLVDVGAALSGRGYLGEGEVVLELADAFVPENAGRWRVSPEGAERTDRAADLRLDITCLGSVYLGEFGFGDLVRASRAEELTPGAAERGDALFRTALAPWCPEIF
jgi:predicted acetyltransferase